MMIALLILSICCVGEGLETEKVKVLTTVAIIATNDIHGSALYVEMQRADTKYNYTAGGLKYMAGLIKTIQEEFYGHTLFLDAGDQFQGGIESSRKVSSGQIINDFFANSHLNASAIGNHEFDFGPSFMLPFLYSKDSQNLVSNLRNEKNASVFLPKQELSHLYEFSSGVKIGVIGLITKDTPKTTDAFKQHLFPAYEFAEYAKVVIEYSGKLRTRGAQAVVVVGHIGNDCNTTNKYGKWWEYTPQAEECKYDEVSQLIDAVPKGTIDAVVQGHRHRFAHRYYKGVPFLGVVNAGTYFNVLYLRFADLLLQDSYIEGPIPVCARVFANLRTCEYEDLDTLASAGELVPWEFHGVAVYADARLTAIYDQEWLPKMKPYLVPLATSEIYLDADPLSYCYLVNLVLNLFHAAVPQTDVAFINPGSLRTQWLPGFILEYHFYNMFPFTNNLISFDILGSELITMLTTVEQGPLGFYTVFGLQQIVSLHDDKRALISVKWSNGSAIDPNARIRGLATDFVLNGGDDFSQVINKTYTLRNPIIYGDVRNLLRPKLVYLALIKKGSLIDPNNKRLIVQ